METSDNELYRKLSDLYCGGNPMHKLVTIAKEMCGIQNEEIMQLIGEKPIKTLQEETIGSLIGIEKIVIFSSAKMWANSAGMLEKKDDYAFYVHPFYPYYDSYVRITESFPKNPNYPFLIHWKKNYWGIENTRWEKMKKWLDKFLP